MNLGKGNDSSLAASRAMTNPPPSQAARWRALAVALPVVVAALAARRELAPDGIGTDDAHIFLRYAANLAQGDGWVWNPGGVRVDGTTSALWTLVAALVRSFTAPGYDALFVVALAVVVVALALWLDELVAIDGISGSGAAGGAAALAAGLYLAAVPSFAIWTAASLMDGGLWCATLLLVAATHHRLARTPENRTARCAAMAAAAQVALALARPESLLVGPLLLLAAAAAARRPPRLWLAPLVAAAGTQAALALGRRVYFGWPLPNTYYAKVDAELAPRLASGLEWLRHAAADLPVTAFLWLIAAVALPLALARRREASDDVALALAAAGVLAGPLVVLLEGGDYFAGQRPLVPLRPFEAALVLLLAVRLLPAAWPARRRWGVAALTLAGAAAIAFSANPIRWGTLAVASHHRVDFETARRGFDEAARLNRLVAPLADKPVVGVLAAGAFPLAYAGASRDLLGLNDPAIAHASRRRRGLPGHSAFDAGAFFAAPPELVLAGASTCEESVAARLALRQAFRFALPGLDLDPRFTSAYRRVRLARAGDGAPGFCAWARRDWLARLPPGLVATPVETPPRGAGPWP